MASCSQIDRMIQAYLDDELSRVDRLLFEEHLENCAACHRELQQTRACTARLYEALRRDRRPHDLVGGVMVHLPEMRKKRPSWRDSTSSTRSNPDFGKRRKRHAIFRYMPVYVPAVLLVLAVLLWLQWPETIEKNSQALGVVTHSSGLSYSVDASTSRSAPVRTGDLLTAGDYVDTSSDGQLLLGLKGPTHLAIYQNSSMRIDNDRSIVMDRGRMFLDVHREARRFTITTPHGRVTVMGTSFHIQIADEGTEVSVVNGDVLVENDRSFARLARGKKALFEKDSSMRIASLSNGDSFVEEARALSPDIQAQRFFLSQIFSEPVETPILTGEQVFVVKTGQRTVNTLVLRWVPDPYLSGHASYTVYISDNAMRPVFKYNVLPLMFEEKTRNSLEIEMPAGQEKRDMSVLHVSLLPVQGSGYVETSFTEVLAVGAK